MKSLLRMSFHAALMQQQLSQDFLHEDRPQLSSHLIYIQQYDEPIKVSVNAPKKKKWSHKFHGKVYHGKDDYQKLRKI